jgi:hypothetical protein
VSNVHESGRIERRASRRTAIERRIRYRVVGRVAGRRRVELSGGGKTINMSSVGMLIETDQVLLPGWRVEIEVNGPFQVDDQVFLKLLVTGKIVRSVSTPIPLAGIKISRHMFQMPRSG